MFAVISTEINNALKSRGTSTKNLIVPSINYPALMRILFLIVRNVLRLITNISSCFFIFTSITIKGKIFFKHIKAKPVQQQLHKIFRPPVQEDLLCYHQPVCCHCCQIDRRLQETKKKRKFIEYSNTDESFKLTIHPRQFNPKLIGIPPSLASKFMSDPVLLSSFESKHCGIR